MGVGRHQRGEKPEGSWLERTILATPAGELSGPGLIGWLIWIAVMSGLAISFTYDDWALNQRAEIVQAEVVRTNYDQRTPTANAILQWPFEGTRVLVEPIHGHPAAGDFIDLQVDPAKPTRVRDLQSRHWEPISIIFIALIPIGLLITWAHTARRLRIRRAA
jgi:hypothetical protein